jgi:hypothetical protein
MNDRLLVPVGTGQPAYSLRDPVTRESAFTAVPDLQDLIAGLRRLPRPELIGMYEAAAEATDCVRTLAETGHNPVTEVLQGASVVDEWAHYPEGDVFDPRTGARYYYHAHAADERVGNEHGHFHTFMRPQMLGLSVSDQQRQAAPTALAHLIGISTDAYGSVIRLFTTNRWVTGETWYDADSMFEMLARFDIDLDLTSRPLNRWLTKIVRMFRPQIVDLIYTRDERIANYQVQHADSNVFEDRGLQITSEMPIEFLAQIRAIERALGSPDPLGNSRSISESCVRRRGRNNAKTCRRYGASTLSRFQPAGATSTCSASNRGGATAQVARQRASS